MPRQDLMDIHCRCLPAAESNTAVVQVVDNWEMPLKILLDLATP
jgi:hypothetical protein